MWTLKLSKQAHEFYESLSGKHRTQIEHAFENLAHDPHSGKSLKGDLKGYWSCRVGIYRILYMIKHREIVIEILRIQHRKEVYENFRR